MELLTISQKVCIDASAQIKQLCNFLIKKTPIASFGINREFFDGHRVTLTTSAEWTEHYLTMDYHQRLDGYESFYENAFTIWHPFSEETMIKDARENFNICDGITLSYFGDGYVDLYHFAAATNDNFMTNWYLNHLDFIKHFAHQICQQFDATFKHITPYKALDKNCAAKYLTMLQKKQKTIFSMHELIETPYKKAPPINQRELQILSELSRGNTAKEAAKTLLLSPRTIEHYILKLRQKFGCHTKSQLIKFVLAKKILQPY